MQGFREEIKSRGLNTMEEY
jgi:actin-related protein 5